jgi:phospholipase/lecithinase/hemolysin
MVSGSRRVAAFAALAFVASPLLAAPAARAATYSAEYVFGDSLSDNGNLASLATPFPFPPSYHDSFTNGPVAVAGLASDLGLSLEPSLWVTGSTGRGTNYAVAGATAAFDAVGGPPLINLPEQVGAYGLYAASHMGAVDPATSLYVVMIGGDDVRNAALHGTGQGAITTGVNAELAAISTLAAENARHFLVVNVPNVGLIPEFSQDNASLAATATTLSQLYDRDLATGLAAIGSSLPTGTSLTQFDLYGYNAGLLANASALGFKNTTDRCYTDTPYSASATPQCGPDGANIGTFAYWDSIHPTARVHALWAQGMDAALGSSAVPEPSTWAMLLAGFAALGLAGRRARRATATTA